jgi:hypothetical protein
MNYTIQVKNIYKTQKEKEIRNKVKNLLLEQIKRKEHQVHKQA